MSKQSNQRYRKELEKKNTTNKADHNTSNMKQDSSLKDNTNSNKTK